MILALAWLGCGNPTVAPVQAPEAQAAASVLTPGPSLHGTCDASAGVWLGDTLWVADDERNELLRFPADGSEPVPVDLSASFPQLRGEEADLEAVASLGGRIWWVGSHDRGKGTKPKKARQRLFSTTPRGAAGKLRADLLQRMASHPQVAPVLAATAHHTSKHPAGLSIEGLVGLDDTLWVGFRAPVVDGKALVVPITDPAGTAEAGPPTWLDLGGRGVRAMEAVGGEVILVAGPPDGRGSFALYRWQPGAPPEPIEVDLGDLRPEGLAWNATDASLWLLSDDGSLEREGHRCKDLPVARRRARTARWTPP